jgi:glutathione S-transferase
MALKLWHCPASRSIRPLWTLEEMGLKYELEVMEFPPRFMHPGYTDINPIGTVPFFIDGDVQMTESAGISEYLANKYGPTDLVVTPDETAYGEYLNWVHRSDATLTFPQTVALRYQILEPDKGLQQAGDDYIKWFFSRLRTVERAMSEREFLCAERFTLADICVGMALYLADAVLDLRGGFKPNTEAYYARLSERPAFKIATAR